MTIALDFYNQNKQIQWSMPSLPVGVKSDYEIADWLLNKSDFGWLKLDINIDIGSWQKETEVARYVDHRGSDHPGWNSCCLHGISVEKTGAWTNYGYTDESQVPYHWTELSDHTPTIKSFWQNFPYEKFRRIRFMQLEPGGHISPHSDAPGKLPGEIDLDMLEFGVPINVAVIHPDQCFMSLEDYGTVPFYEGAAFIINIRNFHSVINLSDRSRIHLIAHGIPGNKKDQFVELVARSYKKQYAETH